ncbi:uncharacterized protein LOC108916055 [Anoplophora glabripennis]|uniref:uncharacterized protein LOC108916055 n=1 Tax=Anoplophora glabripennis TaxID=217634 RepID=UPI0008738070|nr:uncharacterized protein LOC108916055 [Anoplophora glabripennis]
MSKTPISILQELMVQKKVNLPDYYIENCDIPGATFKCTVRVGSVKAIGYASTKKEAKQNSAKKALEMLGYGSSSSTVLQKEITLLVNYSTKQAPFINYVGKLNELASTHGKPYPVYHDEPMPNANGIFVTKCNFLEFSALGCGSKRKDAKQDAARNILDK